VLFVLLAGVVVSLLRARTADGTFLIGLAATVTFVAFEAIRWWLASRRLAEFLGYDSFWFSWETLALLGVMTIPLVSVIWIASSRAKPVRRTRIL